MKFHNPNASVFVPDGKAAEEAFRRITHLGIGAHQDDLEIMAFHGIEQCFNSPDCSFGAVTCTNGGGSPRAGEYAAYSDADMAALRRREQEKAALIGNYGVLVQLNYTSAEVKSVTEGHVQNDLVKILKAVRPEIVYTHNPADKHDTHVAVVLTALAAIRALAPADRPKVVFGCEVWRNLDWMSDEDKVPMDVGAHEGLAMALIGVYDSQVAGGKRYDVATLGRRRANATYFQSHETDEADQLWFAMNLTPLVKNDSLDIADFVLGHIDKFRKDVADKIRNYSVKP
ncbi:MAG: PIG-L family deacetylase [Candidatus Aminicenantales bacterium]|jgi:LmbE family N-acetylglucosaminyl deacetylase